MLENIAEAQMSIESSRKEGKDEWSRLGGGDNTAVMKSFQQRALACVISEEKEEWQVCGTFSDFWFSAVQFNTELVRKEKKGQRRRETTEGFIEKVEDDERV